MTEAPYQVMPPLSTDEKAALKADIAARGVQVPVEYDEAGAILDGHHRVQICGELEITQWPRLVRYGLSEPEKRRHARRLNLDRRHLDHEQKRLLIADDLRETPDSSDRAIASGLGVDHKTVGSVRDGLEATGEIPQLEARQGRDKKVRRITQFVPSNEAEDRGVHLAARELNVRRGAKSREARVDLARALSDKSLELTGTRQFPCIYADPPWSRKAGIGGRAYENHYPTMSWDEIMALPVGARALPDAWLFLWLPRAHVLALHPVKYKIAIDDGSVHEIEIKTPLAWAIARAWGFAEFSTLAVWTKTDEDHPDDAGTGLIFRDQDEILCLFKKGRGLPMPEEKFGSNHRERSKPLGHSKKPPFYREMIAKMTGGLPVLELFYRHDENSPLPENWEGWGNESKGDEASCATPADSTVAVMTDFQNADAMDAMSRPVGTNPSTMPTTISTMTTTLPNSASEPNPSPKTESPEMDREIIADDSSVTVLDPESADDLNFIPDDELLIVKPMRFLR